ncbi:hypothetical protein [Kibdelosporangium aridum]|uniref:hypothetical protein n=1 Tax=Kibdelosporangium aridum TaxID=2030 RepID=UPI0035E58DE7
MDTPRQPRLALCANGVSLLWITYDVAAVDGAVGRVLVMDAGRVVDAPCTAN